MDSSNLAFLRGGGEMGARMRELDWSRSPLGPVDAWPQSLRSTVSLLLPSKAQIIVFWGPDLVVLYNDAYAAMTLAHFAARFLRNVPQRWVGI